MKKIYFITCIAIAIFTTGKVKSQDLTTYNLYIQNPVLLNPAYSLDSSKFRQFVNSHAQWTSLKGMPRSNTFGIYGTLNKNMGIGLGVFNLIQGITRNTNVHVSYAYRTKLDKNQILTFGITAGTMSDKLARNEIVVTDPNDPTISDNVYTRTTFSSRVGLAYLNRRFEVQLIMPQFLERNKISTYTIGMISYNYNISPMWNLKPSFMVRGVSTSPSQFDIDVVGTYDHAMWVQLGYRSNKSVVLGYGLNIKGFELGYIYQIESNNIAPTATGTHEIQLIYRIHKSKPIIQSSNIEVVPPPPPPPPVVEPKVVPPPPVVEPIVVPPPVVEPKVIPPPEKPIENPVKEKPGTFEIINIVYNSNSDVLSEDNITVLNNVVSILKEYPSLKAEISGHTDYYGATAYNKGLSDKRVKNCVNYIKSKGIDPKRIVKAKGYGETHPLVPNTTKDNLKTNRRVSFNFFY